MSMALQHSMYSSTPLLELVVTSLVQSLLSWGLANSARNTCVLQSDGY